MVHTIRWTGRVSSSFGWAFNTFSYNAFYLSSERLSWQNFFSDWVKLTERTWFSLACFISFISPWPYFHFKNINVFNRGGSLAHFAQANPVRFRARLASCRLLLFAFFLETNFWLSKGDDKRVFRVAEKKIVCISNRELKHQTFLIHRRHGWPRRTGSGTRFACQLQIIKQNNVKP